MITEPNLVAVARWIRKCITCFSCGLFYLGLSLFVRLVSAMRYGRRTWLQKHEFKVAQKNKLVCAVWKDTRVVIMLSNGHKPVALFGGMWIVSGRMFPSVWATISNTWTAWICVTKWLVTTSETYAARNGGDACSHNMCMALATAC